MPDRPAPTIRTSTCSDVMVVLPGVMAGLRPGHPRLGFPRRSTPNTSMPGTRPGKTKTLQYSTLVIRGLDPQVSGTIHASCGLVHGGAGPSISTPPRCACCFLLVGGGGVLRGLAWAWGG